jgi:hypothetical protein
MEQHPYWQLAFVKELENAIDDEGAVGHYSFDHAAVFDRIGERANLQWFGAGFKELESIRGDGMPLMSRIAIAQIRWQPLEQTLGEDAEAPLVFKLVAGFLLTCFADHWIT